jgi:GTPase SAR1 family protein
MEKTISIRNTEITFSIWDLGGQREFVNMLPLVCNDAVAILFMFDLTRKSTLNSIKEWYRQGRGFNKTAIPFLIGTKYDHFVNFPREDQEEISNQVCATRLQSLEATNKHYRHGDLLKRCERVSFSAAQVTASMSRRSSRSSCRKRST